MTKNINRWLIAGTWLGLSLAGCSKSPGPEQPKSTATPNVSVQPNPQNGSNGSTDGANPAVPTVADYNQKFEEAAITEVLDGHHLPPDITVGGKKTGPLPAAIEDSWLKFKLADAAGKPVPYLLRLETSEGLVEIKLRPEIAPNHVRNILALAHHGYYDGLQFERNIHQEAVSGTPENPQKNRLDMLIAGCPTGTGDDGYGHIGYFMRREFQTSLKHDIGTVGFWHEEDPDSAGCRFYITLGPAPILDGKFTIIGNVSTGLDVVKKIAVQPVQNAETSPENEKPARPIVIKRVTVAPSVMEKPEPIAQNGR